jgi:hypothetical protein
MELVKVLRVRSLRDKMSLYDSGGGSLRQRREGMAARGRTLAVCAIAVIGLIGVGTASAASPQRIYADLADNGRLDGRYSRADIERALNLRQVLRTDEGARPAVRRPTSRPSRPPEGSATLPFTGLDLALLTLGGGPLLLIGLGIRRRVAGAESSRVGVVRS